MPSVVITGAGLVCALGPSKQPAWAEVRKGHCGIKPLSSIEQPLPPGQAGGEARFISGAQREGSMLRKALVEALTEAGISGKWPYEGHRVAIIVGTTLAGMRAAGRFLRTNDLEQLRHFTAAAVLQQALAGIPSTGLSCSTCAACASGLTSIGLGLTLLRDESCDLVIAGGYDPISEYVCAGFNSLRLVASGPPRPFSRLRSGMNLGEGAAIVVLERTEDAVRRGAKPMAIVDGYGESSDAHHLTQPDPTGEGASRAIEAALHDAGVAATQVDFISAHATATPHNDAAEYAAYERVFGTHLSRVNAVAFKSHLGHTLGGAGTVELVLSLLAMRDQTAPPSSTIDQTECEFPNLDLVVETSRPARISRTMNMSMGFGGANACVILKNPELPEHPSGSGRSNRPRRPRREVLITGIGVVLPGAVGNEAFVRLITSNPATRQRSLLEEVDYAHLFNARRVRRMSDYVKCTLAATTLAMRDASIDDEAAFAQRCGAIIGTTHGAAGYSEAYYRQVVNEGIAAANPLLFAEGVPNVGSAQLSLMLGLKGGAQAIIGSRTAGLDALHLAARRIATGEADRLIVTAGEERTDLLIRAYRMCTDSEGFIGSGAVAFVLESPESAAERVAVPRGTVIATDCRRADGSDSLPGAVENLIATHGKDCVLFTLSSGLMADTFSVNALAEIAAALLSGSSQFSVVARDPIGLATIACIKPHVR